MILDELSLVQMPTLKDLAIIMEPHLKEHIEPIEPLRGQTFFKNLVHLPLKSIRLFTKENPVIASQISSILDHNSECPCPCLSPCAFLTHPSNPAQRLEAITFDNPDMTKSISSNYPALMVLILHVIAPDSGSSLLLSGLELPYLQELQLSMKGTFDTNAFWGGQFSSPQLRQLTVVSALTEHMGVHRLRLLVP
ncbi:hypothetical protein BDN71DRAFT_1510907 [Pleurotus eryngii]|uniref:Uncharacterized protein n=1 Tax=Pleurotus eryngii TaxID=5323 RepID=A0A9P5ZS43_PLEER|nr:hypothetical protein BDN71DRAFT_1510907 [Pleurotus eryngii]